ncbi:MAG: hypothetical protein ACI93R_002419 [Flavobacteriales bacterium]|jgi:hypothetical protein
MRRWIVIFLSLVVCVNVSASANLTSLISNGIHEWESKVFSGESIYTVREYKGRIALQVLSKSSASVLLLKRNIDLTITPYIRWSWLAETMLFGLDEHSRDGDDFVARIYVVIDGGAMMWKTKSLNYVWSSNQDKAIIWDNAFAGSKSKMMSVRGKESKQGVWYEEKRNVYKDLISAFGDKGTEEANLKAYKTINVVAIMTDTDNSGEEAESYYGDIVFSAM